MLNGAMYHECIHSGENIMNQKDITLQYTFIQTTFWMGFAAISAFASVYLLSMGISNSVIGLVISLGAMASAVLQPVVGNLVDNHPKVTLKKVMSTAAAFAVIIAMLLYPFAKASAMVIAVLYGMLILIIQFGQPFSNAIGMAGQNARYKLLFGPARALGSLGYALVAYLLGIVTVKMGPHIVPLFVAVIFLVHFLSVVIFPVNEKQEVKVSPEESQEQNSKSTTVIGFLKKYKSFLIMLIGLVFIYFSHVVLNSFALQIITPRGGTSANMGTATAISAGIELVPMIFFPVIRKKVKINHMLRLSVMFFTLKVLFTYLADNVIEYYAAQAFQMLGWGVMAVAIVYFVNENISEHDQAQGQAFAGMALTVGNVIGGLFGGVIIDAAGINALLLTALASGTIGTAIFWLGIGRSEKE